MAVERVLWRSVTSADKQTVTGLCTTSARRGISAYGDWFPRTSDQLSGQTLYPMTDSGSNVPGDALLLECKVVSITYVFGW